MTYYTAADFRRDLEEELEKGYEVIRIARAAYRIFSECEEEFEPGLEDKILAMVVMEEGPEFEYTEAELWDFARKLTEGADLKEE